MPKTKQLFVEFSAHENQEFGFDAVNQVEWINNYDTIISKKLRYYIPYKSIGVNSTDQVDAVIYNRFGFRKDSLEFYLDKQEIPVRFIEKNDSVFTLFLPKKDKNYEVTARYKSNVVGKLEVVVYQAKIRHISLVPLVQTKINVDSLERHLNEIYRQANIQYVIDLKPFFKSDKINPERSLSNPSPNHDRFTRQMRDYRDEYFQTFPAAGKKTTYIFIIDGFVDPMLNGYSVRKKSLTFVKNSSEKKLARSIAQQLGFSVGLLKETWLDEGPERGSTSNLMDFGKGIHLTHEQWENLRHGTNSFSFYDNYEDVVTNNGIVAYYFWKEDKSGNIIVENNSLLESIKRPYKKNYKSYHLEIKDFFYQPLFRLFKYPLNLWHLISAITIIILVFVLQRKLLKRIRKRIRKVGFWKWSSRFIGIFVCISLTWITFILIDRGYARFEVDQGHLKELDRFNTDQAIKRLLDNHNVKEKSERALCSEILIGKERKWFVKKKKPVLYFTVQRKGESDSIIIRYSHSSNRLYLKTLDYTHTAESHYLVFSYLDGKEITEQRVYNHVGIELTNKLQLEDPAKRILIFVNGYRPTSVGHTFEENFYDVQKHGLEYTNSNNLIYNFDRYDYWRPWQQVDLLFQQRINPSESYYADGHFSVSTSNHESLINFTTVSSIYPKRCKNIKKHVCYYTTVAGSGLFGSKRIKTKELHRTKPNRKGFRERMENGRIAGRNFIQLCNEIPNRSMNDTVYLVVHSMGYAYSLGMIEEMRGKINFGGFYIIAPENATAGRVRKSEWKEIWQYGSNFNRRHSDAPCLQDGVAPQAKVAGLPRKNRAYIPENLYMKKGFFDSHFIGYYRWIFDIPKGGTGYITQR